MGKAELALDILPKGGFCKARKGGQWQLHAQTLDLDGPGFNLTPLTSMASSYFTGKMRVITVPTSEN